MNETTLSNVSRYVFVFLMLILPIWLLPYTVFPLELNKAFLFYALVIIAFIFWLISVLQKAGFEIPKSGALLVLAAIILVSFVSSLFSGNTPLSLIGSGHEVGTFFSLIMMGIALFLVSVLFESEAKAMAFYLALFISSLAVFIFQLFLSGFDIVIFPWNNIFASKIGNTIGSWNEVGIFFGFIALSALVFVELIRLPKWLKIFVFAILAASLATVAFVNFTVVWILLGAFILVFFAHQFFSVSNQPSGASEIREVGRPLGKFVRFTVPLLLIAIFFIMAKTLVGDFVSSMGIDYAEVRPTWTATWQVAKSALKENILLGTGPNTFLYDWLRFKPADINMTLFWAFPFTVGIGLLPTWFATSGIFAGLAWLAFLAFLFYYGLKTVAYFENELLRGLLVASFLGSLYLWTFTIIYPTGFLLTALAFLITGVFIALLCRSGKIKIIEVSFSNKPKLGFASSLFIVLLMIAAVAAFYLLFQKYYAAYSFGRGISVINASGNIDEGENLIFRASRFDQQDKYYRALSEVGLIRLQKLLNQANLPANEATVQFQNILGNAIANAQNAIRVNSLDYQNWMSLGQIYEAVVPLKIAGAREAAIDAYKKAFEVAPFDPRPFLASARVEYQVGDIKSSKNFLNSSVGIKGDFAPAFFLLSQIEAQEGNLKEAIKRTEQTYLLAPNDVGVFFQLGLLYYQDKNYEAGRLAFEKLVSINPNYSNARYFLGLIYERQERVSDAIGQFKRIQELNPDNKEVQLILSNLTSGKPALESISPPQPSPEKRKEPPVEEEMSGKDMPKNKK